MNQGIDKGRIEIKGFGKKHPIWTVEDEAWKAHENRCIKITILSK